MIYVCSLWEMEAHVRELSPGCLVSLVGPAEQPPTPARIPAERHLRIAVDDISEPLPGYIVPEEHHISSLIEFLRCWQGDRPVLMHCLAGISRSMAAALIALALETEGREAEVAQQMREIAPHAQPNRRMVALADGLLDRHGRLVAAREEMGPAELLLHGPLVRLPWLG
jgi:predicted protein tyrosine phosphatase